MTISLYDTVKSPASYKPMSIALFWTIVVVAAGFFVILGWLFIHGHSC